MSMSFDASVLHHHRRRRVLAMVGLVRRRRQLHDNHHLWHLGRSKLVCANWFPLQHNGPGWIDGSVSDFVSH